MAVLHVALDVSLLAFTVGATWAGTKQVMKAKTAEGVSLVGNVMLLLCVSTWMAYGVANGNVSQVTTGAVCLIGVLAVLAVAHRNGELRTGLTLGISAAFAAIVILTGLAFGIAAAGVIATALSVVGKFPQIWESWKNPGGVAVSISSFAMNGACSAAWVLYGGLQNDAFIVASSVLAVFQAVFVIVRTVQGRKNHQNNVVTIGATDKADVSLQAA